MNDDDLLWFLGEGGPAPADRSNLIDWLVQHPTPLEPTPVPEPEGLELLPKNQPLPVEPGPTLIYKSKEPNAWSVAGHPHPVPRANHGFWAKKAIGLSHWADSWMHTFSLDDANARDWHTIGVYIDNLRDRGCDEATVKLMEDWKKVAHLPDYSCRLHTTQDGTKVYIGSMSDHHLAAYARIANGFASREQFLPYCQEYMRRHPSVTNPVAALRAMVRGPSFELAQGPAVIVGNSPLALLAKQKETK